MFSIYMLLDVQKKQRLELFFKMEKTFGQIEESNNEVQPTQTQSQDETSVAVANLTSILKSSKSPNGTVLTVNIKLHHPIFELIFIF